MVAIMTEMTEHSCRRRENSFFNKRSSASPPTGIASAVGVLLVNRKDDFVGESDVATAATATATAELWVAEEESEVVML